MAATEDDLAKKQVQEAAWAWTGRVIVLAVAFGFGFFAAWVLWGAGLNGAPALRETKTNLESQVLEFKNKRVDLEGQLTVIQGRLAECTANLAKCRAGTPAQ